MGVIIQNSEEFSQKYLSSITQGKTERVQDYAARIELALYQPSNEMTKDNNKGENEVMVKVVTRRAQNTFVDDLHAPYIGI